MYYSDSDSDDETPVRSKVIDGKAIAAQIRREVGEAVKVLAEESSDYGPPITPGLAVILGRCPLYYRFEIH